MLVYFYHWIKRLVNPVMQTALSCFFLFSSLRASFSSTSETYDVHENLNQRLFSKIEYHYLNVPRVGKFTVYDDFECTFICLRDHLCISINLAAFKGFDGKLWCELLSSDKYRNAEDYHKNKTSHHLSIMSPCWSSPCHNGGTCLMNANNTFECVCEKGVFGKYCETAPNSCKKLNTLHKLNSNQVVTLLFDSKPTSIFCHVGDFGCGDGEWTPVMKIDGSKRTFHYSSSYWTDTKEYNIPGGKTGFDLQETKLPTYWSTPFTKICLGMKIGNQTRFIVINKQANSLYSLIADGKYHNTSLGRNTWKTLIGSQASLQYYCDKEGFNLVCSWSDNSKARIGILSNNENLCSSCDSRIGFGTGGIPDDSNTCGNAAIHLTDNGDKYITAMGYILVQ